MRRAAKRDDNEAAIIAALMAVGCSVTQLSGTDIPDLLVGYKGNTYLLEAKQRLGKLTSGQETWHRSWRGGPLGIVRTPQAALDAIGAKATIASDEETTK